MHQALPARKPVDDQQSDKQRERNRNLCHVSLLSVPNGVRRTPGLTGPDQSRRPEESDGRSCFRRARTTLRPRPPPVATAYL